MAKSITAAKSAVYMRPTVSTADNNTLAEWDALTGWVRIGGITNIGAHGPTFAEIKSEPIDATATGKYKGMRDDGNMQLDMEFREGDEGQDILTGEALESYDNWDFKVELNNKPAGASSKPSRRYFPAKVMGYPFDIGNSNKLCTTQITLAIDGAAGGVVTGPRTVGA